MLYQYDSPRLQSNVPALCDAAFKAIMSDLVKVRIRQMLLWQRMARRSSMREYILKAQSGSSAKRTTCKLTCIYGSEWRGVKENDTESTREGNDKLIESQNRSGFQTNPRSRDIQMQFA